jgi:2-iminobutanoate/2-iminopropanoate deaminase
LANLSDLTSEEGINSALMLPGLLLLDVYTQDCVICRRLEPMIAAVAATSGGTVRAHKLDAARHAEFAARHDIRGVPTLLLFRDGRLIERRAGFATASALREWIAAQPGEAKGAGKMPAHKLVNATDAPPSPGPFSHATVIGPWVYVSGMGGLDPKTGQVISDDVIEQTRQTIANLAAILAAAGCTLHHVVKATVYLTDMADYPRVNKVYEDAFAPNRPARTCVAVSALPVRERMKIDLVAYREGE